VFNVACSIHLFAEYIGRPSTVCAPFRLHKYDVKPDQMTGASMLPTLAYEGELVIENRLTFRLFPNRLSRGDLVTLKSPLEPGRIICKRIIGLPGDVVCVDPTGERAPSKEHVKIPEGHVWISGDNAAWSRDSRDYGPVSISLIQGKVVAKVRAGTLLRCYVNFHEYRFGRYGKLKSFAIR
jgi:mitochondrial inner membrane protease subunit 1